MGVSPTAARQDLVEVALSAARDTVPAALSM